MKLPRHHLPTILIVAVAAACGGTGPDMASEPDAAPGGDVDAASSIDADPGEPRVRVEASSFDGPLAGVTVAFLDASDATLGVVTTTGDGIATGIVPPGGSVVAGSPARDRAYL